ncbi:asparaginase [Halomonas lysinitropha]|uniref:L-asparaginase 1 n=1 Tax=Halomonas lysinitropha TaxID=2607506 RepID=A0A5K1I6Z7_9GAMM|nr:asparaginase [Halomonas lysinitropha]VVZ97175.1 L-asparaginase 1 [Halomonas lysinitropha]
MSAPVLEERTVLVIYTGGTLGMIETARGLAPGGHIEARLRRALADLPPVRRASLPPFEVLETDRPIDSSSATPEDWQRLASLVAHHYRQHAGIVILHGTDTLAWTASSLAFQLLGLDRPVILTGAMRPLEAEGSDAVANVEDALRFAVTPRLQEVAICFAGKLLRGCRSRKWRTREADAFTSPNQPLLGERVDDEVVLYPGRGLVDHQRGAPRLELADYSAIPPGAIVRLALWPGIQAWQLEAWLRDDRVKGVVLEAWGGGNLPDDPALVGALARASGEGKLLAALSQCPHGPVAFGGYAAGRGLADAGVLSADDMTPEATFTKLVHLLALPLPEEERRRRFLAPLVGER